MPKRRVKDEDDFVVDDDLDLDLEALESDEFIDDEDEELEKDARSMKGAAKAKANDAKRGAKRSAAEGKRSVVPCSPLFVRKRGLTCMAFDLSMSTCADDVGKPKAKKSATKPKAPVPPTEPTTFSDGWTAFPPFLLYKGNTTAQGSSKIAAFDLDGTLILRRSESQWGPIDANDWRWFNESVQDKLAELCESGYQIIIFSNQGTIKKALTGKASEKIRGLIDNVLKSLTGKGVQAQVLLATASPDQGDKFRKPSPGMWEFFVDNLNKSVSPNLDECFYVGDAAGRDTDINNGSSSDKDFAAAVGIPFHLPEDYFGCAEATSYGENFVSFFVLI